MLADVIKKNQEINELVKKIIDQRRETGLSIDDDPDVPRAIFEAELIRCITTYETEFEEYECLGEKKFSFVTEERETADCFGGLKGLQITNGMQKFIDEDIKPIMKQLGYSIKDDGEVYFDENGNTRNLPSQNTYLNTNYDGSLKDQMDFFAYLYSRNGIDMDWVIDVLPHEAMHTFGIVGGNAYFKEGATEQLTRETCEKYGIYMTASSHTQEANFIKKLELVVGRDAIVSAGRFRDKSESKDRYKVVAEKFEENLGMQAGTFEKLLNVLDELYGIQMGHKTDPRFYRDLYSKDWSEILTDNEYLQIMQSLEIDESQLQSIKKNGFDLFENGKGVNSFSQLMEPINDYIRDNGLETAVDRTLDENKDYSRLESVLDGEIEVLTQILDRNKSAQHGKKGLDDCMQDSTLRDSKAQEATEIVTETVLGKEELLKEKVELEK